MINQKTEKIKITIYTMDDYKTQFMVDDISHYIESKYKITIDEFCKIANNKIGSTIVEENL